MLRIFFTLLISIGLYAQDKIEIYTSSLETQDNIVRASNGVSVVYKNYYLSAQNATYDKNSGELELFGDVRANNGSEYKILGDKAVLNIANKQRSFEPFFMLDNESRVWMSGDNAIGYDKDLSIKGGVISGCNPNNPLWKMEFTSSDYNTDTKWLNIYNARIYIYDIPVFYTPYFGRSLNKERRTGLLTPSFGVSSSEGFYYEQALFIAKNNWWDLEIKPQVRTSRGEGIYSTLRFIDSEISSGEISLGYFQEQEKFFLEQNLANEKHYGYNIHYKNSSFINQWFKTNLSGQSGLYIDIKNMNDVDYINLSSNDVTKNVTATQLLSQGNFFYNTSDNYLGTYFKYYKDLTIETNENTLQILPTIHYHHYIETFFKDYLLYDIDMQINNIQRNINKNVLQTDLNIPVTLQTALFDEYLNLAYTSHIYGQSSNFSGSQEELLGVYADGLFVRQYNTLELSSEVVRSYDDFSHSIAFSSKYTIAGLETTNGYYDDNKKFCADTNNRNNARCDFYNITDIDEALEIDFREYIFDLSGRQIFYHRLAQVIANKNSELGELENEFDYQITNNINFYNNIFYNYDNDKFSKLLHKLSYKSSALKISLSHLFKDTFIDKTDTNTPRTSYITSSARYTYDTHYSYKVKMDYDLETSLKKGAEVGFLYKKRCWNFGLKYVENNRPILTKDNISSSVYDRYIYFNIVFKPFMSGGDTDIDLELPSALKGV